MVKLNNTYDVEKILLELSQIENNFAYVSNQISLQSCGSDISSGKTSHLKYPETSYVDLLIPDNYEISKFIKDHKLYRTRVMKLLPMTCYSYHMDYCPRIHIALLTHEKCFFVEETILVHIPADGHPYWVDTEKYHTAFNGASNLERIHIVGCTTERMG